MSSPKQNLAVQYLKESFTMQRVLESYQFLIRIGLYLSPVALLLIRLAWGWELVESGYAHLSDVPAMVERFQQWGVPFPHLNVYISAYTEMIGGALLMVGLASRMISIPLFFNFCVAYATASRDTVVNFFHQDPSKFIDDAAFPFLVTSLLILAVGPGYLSIDRLIKYLIFDRSEVAKPGVNHSSPPSHGITPSVAS